MTPRRARVVSLSTWEEPAALEWRRHPVRRRRLARRVRQSPLARLRALPGLLPTIEVTILAFASGLLLWATS